MQWRRIRGDLEDINLWKKHRVSVYICQFGYDLQMRI